MDVRVVVVLGGAEPGAEVFSGIPLALLPVLGRSMLERTLRSLRDFGFAHTTIVSEYAATELPDDVHWIRVQPSLLWRTVQKTFEDLSRAGANLVLVLRMGPYAEIDYPELLQFHVDQANRVTAIVRPDGEFLHAFLIDASRRNDAAYLFRHGLKTPRLPHSPYEFAGYANALAVAGDLRRIAIDAFCGNSDVQPDGAEIKPGVWAAQSAQIHKRARVLAPAYIGAHARVRASAVITRCSALEHHAHVDCGTVVDNATLLPDTSVGAGLDVAHAVVGFRRFAHLGRKVDIEIADRTLVSTVSRPPVRLLGLVASLAGYLPVQIVRGFFSGAQAPPATLPEAVQSPPPALKEAAGEQGINLAAVRRYGNE